MTNYRKKLIEVALPLEEINKASAKEKSIRHGHPSTLHLWWARRPLATCRAVIFASLVDDPDDPESPAAYIDACKRLPKGAYADLVDTPRQRLFDFIVKLVQWENSNNESILTTARELINLATDGNPPPVLDPFCGGGSIPLEAQRLGLKAYASDLNPVAVLITKALIEIPPKFANQPPVSLHSDYRSQGQAAKGKGGKLKLGTGGYKVAQGLAEDVQFYGQWMRDQAEQRISQFYPKAKLPDGTEATVIAWLWARTVTCPNPACGCRMPLVRSFELSKRKGKEAWVEPIVRSGSPPTIQFSVRSGKGVAEGTMGGRHWRCLACGTTGGVDHIKTEGIAGRLGEQLMAIVGEGRQGRVYLSPDAHHALVASSVVASWKPEQRMADDPRNFWTLSYGIETFSDLFTPRQLLALTTFCDLVGEARLLVHHDGLIAGRPDDGVSLSKGGVGAQAYADAVATYLAFGASRQAMSGCSVVTWNSTGEKAQRALGRQAIPMTWDYAECNPLATSTGSIESTIELLVDPLQHLGGGVPGTAMQQDARDLPFDASSVFVATDPPYYDNIAYADLSDFFYVWLRPVLGEVLPQLFSTMLTPKSSELVATPYRHDGSKKGAAQFFETGLACALEQLHRIQLRQFPALIYYAFKQSDTDQKGSASTGWETFLHGLIQAGNQITSTWPMQTELVHWSKGTVNALATSVVLACRPRPDSAREATKQEFLREMRRELGPAVREMQKASIAPVDLAQAAIGPGMQVYSRYSRVVSAEGGVMSVREALQAINAELDTVLSEGTEELDSATQWAVAWFESYGYEIKEYGLAEQLAVSKNVTVARLAESGILASQGGKVRLLKREEYDPARWDPGKDTNLNTWELTQRLIVAVDRWGSKPVADKSGGLPAYSIIQLLAAESDKARELAYRLYNFCERKGLSKEALAYNTLVQEWPELLETARSEYEGGTQGRLL